MICSPQRGSLTIILGLVIDHDEGYGFKGGFQGVGGLCRITFEKQSKSVGRRGERRPSTISHWTLNMLLSVWFAMCSGRPEPVVKESSGERTLKWLLAVQQLLRHAFL